ncbi:arylsulfatase G isoform X1 [Pleurodeles waltl]|uniref:arylsulfatase G isoform X1 n=1 Tax=Pleurodeles waltl TaxID=8319 RepID=UPI0037094160
MQNTGKVVKLKKKLQEPTDYNCKPISVEQKKCYRCGSTDHLAFFKKCPARNQKCSHCGVVGHYAKVCRRKSVNSKVNVKYIREDSDSNSDDLENANVHQVFCIDYDILGVDQVKRMKPWCELAVGGVLIKLIADSGSPFTIVNEDVWKDKLVEKLGTHLDKSEVVAKSYTGDKIEFVGFRELEFQFKERKAQCKLYVSKKGPSVLGWTDQGDLGIILNPNSPDPVLTIKENCEGKEEILDSYPELFSGIVGLLNDFQHKIELKSSAIPCIHKDRHIPISIKEEVHNELKKLVEGGIIEQVESAEWVSPLVVVRRSNGKVRLCVDLRELNKNILIDQYPLPRINEMFSATKNMCWFSTIDLKSAYHQVPLHQDSRKYTTFITPFGCYQYTRVPFGLASAAAMFQRSMSNIFSGISGVMFFQDDILVMGKNREEHDNKLKQVLEILKRKGLTIEYSKCKLAQEEVVYLGHSISKNGIKPKQALVEAIKEAPCPAGKEDVRAFLGLIEFYSKFIRNFSEKTYHIRQLLKNKSKFIWSDECQRAFQDLKIEICKAPFLKGFDPKCKSIVTTDASNKGLGAVLTQCDDENNEWVVAFASRSLTPAEERYSVIERETLACVWALNHFRQFVWGLHVLLRSDHKPLTRVLTTAGLQNASPRLSRMSVKLLDFTYDVQYWPGVKNKVADFLSRMSLPIKNVDELMGEESCVAGLFDEGMEGIDIMEWKEGWIKYDSLKRIAGYINGGWPEKINLGADGKVFWEVRNELYLENNMMYRGGRAVPPVSLRRKILDLCHEGHLGISKTKQRVKSRYWWPGLDKQIEKSVRKHLNHLYYPLLVPICPGKR